MFFSVHMTRENELTHSLLYMIMTMKMMTMMMMKKNKDVADDDDDDIGD